MNANIAITAVLVAGALLFAAGPAMLAAKMLIKGWPRPPVLGIAICISFACVGLAGANYAAFLAVATELGGFARTGKVEGDTYYLGQHGHYRAVSRRTYESVRTYHEFSQRAVAASLGAAALSTLAGYLGHQYGQRFARRGAPP